VDVPVSLDKVAEDVRKALELPPGYCVFVDYATDNLIVANGSEDEVRATTKSGADKLHDGTPLWGFTLTRALIDDNLHIAQAKEVFPRLVRIVTNTDYVKSLNEIGGLR
jgi:hypothetical protein